MYHSFLFFNTLICWYLEFYNTVNTDNKRFPLSRISATWHQVPHKRICWIVQEIVKNTDSFFTDKWSDFSIFVIFQTLHIWQQLRFRGLKITSERFVCPQKTQKTLKQLKPAVLLTSGCISWFRLSYPPSPPLPPICALQLAANR